MIKKCTNFVKNVRKKEVRKIFLNNIEFNKLIDKALDEFNTNGYIPSYTLAHLLKKQSYIVMRDIRQELEREDIPDINTSEMFILCNEVDQRNRPRDFYKITYLGVLHLAGRYSRYNYTYRKTMTDTHIRLNLLYKR